MLLCFGALNGFAQNENGAIREGNRHYKAGEFQKALPEYQKAVTQNPSNAIARYNLGNAQFRTNQYAEAEKEYDATMNASKDKNVDQKAVYNKGVALTKQKKLLIWFPWLHTNTL